MFFKYIENITKKYKIVINFILNDKISEDL